MHNDEEDNEYLLAQSPQEWKWLLQDEGLLGRTSIIKGTTRAATDTAAAESSIEDALDKLHRMAGQELRVLERHLDQAQKCLVTHQKRLLAVQHCQKEQLHLLDRWLLPTMTRVGSDQLPGGPPTCSDANENTTSSDARELVSLEEEMSRYIAEKIEPRCLEHIQEAWKKHQPKVQEIFQRYQQAMTVSGHSMDWNLLGPALASLSTRIIATSDDDDSNWRTDITTLEQYRKIRRNLREMQSFFHTRTQLHKSTPPFLMNELMIMMTTTSPGSDVDPAAVTTPWDNNKEYDTMLETILRDMTPPAVMLQEWCLWYDLAPQYQQQRQQQLQEEKEEDEPPCYHHNSWVGHCYAAHTQLRTIENLLQKAHNDVTHDEEQVQRWQLRVDQCRESMQILKSELQVKITALFDFEDEIVIVV